MKLVTVVCLAMALFIGTLGSTKAAESTIHVMVPVPSLPQAIPDVIMDYFENNVWMIHNRMVSGTAWNLSPTLLITNKHVIMSDDIEAENMPWVVQRHGLLNRLDVTVKAVHPTLDLALIECLKCPDMGDISDSRILISDLPMGTYVWGGGYPLGLFQISAGVSQTLEGGWLFNNVPTAGGDSGSPLVTLLGGRVVVVGTRTAVLTSSGHPIWHMGLAVPAIHVIDWLAVLSMEEELRDGNL